MYILQNCSFWSFSVSNFFFLCNLPIQKTYCTTVSRYSRRLFEYRIETTDLWAASTRRQRKDQLFQYAFQKRSLVWIFLSGPPLLSILALFLSSCLSLPPVPSTLLISISICLSVYPFSSVPWAGIFCLHSWKHFLVINFPFYVWLKYSPANLTESIYFYFFWQGNTFSKSY